MWEVVGRSRNLPRGEELRGEPEAVTLTHRLCHTVVVLWKGLPNEESTFDPAFYSSSQVGQVVNVRPQGYLWVLLLDELETKEEIHAPNTQRGDA